MKLLLFLFASVGCGIAQDSTQSTPQKTTPPDPPTSPPRSPTSEEIAIGSLLPSQPYDFLYNEGVRKYLENNWEGCVKFLEEAVVEWRKTVEEIARCRKTCSRESDLADLYSATLPTDDQFYERAVRSTLCISKCKSEVLGDNIDRKVESYIRDDFKDRKPYDYLQLCYYKLGRVKDAANAAATVLVSQPEHKVMSANLQYYITEGELNVNDIVNLELKEYGKEYLKGTVAYDKADYKTTIEHMEKSLTLFYEAYADCRFLCEGPFDQGWFPDFIPSIANHYAFTLRCKRRCLWQLSDIFGEIDDEFFPSYFNYLQYSYYQEGDMKKACEAVESYLILSPEDEAQNRNKQFYITQEQVKEDLFVPRENVVALKDREVFEEKFLEYIETSFAFLKKDDEGEIEVKSDGLNTAANTSSIWDSVLSATVTLFEDTNKVEL